MVLSFIHVGAEMRTLPVGGCTLKWTFLIFLNTTSTVIPPTSICLVFILLKDDFEDAFDLGFILQNTVEGLLDHLLTGLHTAPVIRAGTFDSRINIQGQFQNRIAIRVVSARLF